MGELAEYIKEKMTDDTQVCVDPEEFYDWLNKQPGVLNICIYQHGFRTGKPVYNLSYVWANKGTYKQTTDYGKIREWAQAIKKKADKAGMITSTRTSCRLFSDPLIIGMPEQLETKMVEYVTHIGHAGKKLVWGLTAQQELNSLVTEYHKKD